MQLLYLVTHGLIRSPWNLNRHFCPIFVVFLQKKEAAERLNDVTFRIPDLPINPHELHQDISSISLKESSGFTKNKREAPIEALQNSDLDLNIRSNAERSYSIRMAEMELKPPARGATFHGTQEKGPSSSVRKRSESQRTRDKVRNILGRHENAERERKTSENELKSSFKRANTNIDILGQGKYTVKFVFTARNFTVFQF